jgi:hypothetical protein
MTEVYRVGYLERLPLGTPYPGIVGHIGRLLGRLPGAELVIDLTGVGRIRRDLWWKQRVGAAATPPACTSLTRRS